MAYTQIYDETRAALLIRDKPSILEGVIGFLLVFLVGLINGITL